MRIRHEHFHLRQENKFNCFGVASSGISAIRSIRTSACCNDEQTRGKYMCKRDDGMLWAGWRSKLLYQSTRQLHYRSRKIIFNWIFNYFKILFVNKCSEDILFIPCLHAHAKWPKISTIKSTKWRSKRLHNTFLNRYSGKFVTFDLTFSARRLRGEIKTCSVLHAVNNIPKIITTELRFTLP